MEKVIMPETVHITGGRTMWQGEGPACVISDGNYGDDLFRLDNAELRVWKDRGNEFVIQSRHETASDREHSAGYIAVLSGAGLMFDSIQAKRIRFTGVLLEARYYPREFVLEEGVDVGQFSGHDIDFVEKCKSTSKRCKQNPHLIIPFQPPEVAFRSRLVEIDIDFYDRSKTND